VWPCSLNKARAQPRFCVQTCREALRGRAPTLMKARREGVHLLGSLVAPNLVLTAHHCVSAANRKFPSATSMTTDSTTLLEPTAFTLTTVYDAAQKVWISWTGVF